MRKLMLGIVICLLLLSCQKQKEPEKPTKEEIEMQIKETTENYYKKIDLSKKPNEIGSIMVLMYHNIGEEDTWSRSPENFRKDLKTLYERGYRPISLKEYVRGEIDIPLGYKPVVITFDDANRNNFHLKEDGSLDPDCAVGILTEFHKQHPDFPLKATFFANGEIPFRQEGLEQKKISYLIEKGMDLGNHTVSHPDFSEYTQAENIVYELGAQAKYLESISPKGYKVNTLALPFGSRPEDKELWKYLKEGEYKGFAYNHVAILNVGWCPNPSPYDMEFDPESIFRIRASEMDVEGTGLYDWLAAYDRGERIPFVSDGVKEIVTIPERFRDDVAKTYVHRAYFYDENKESPTR